MKKKLLQRKNSLSALIAGVLFCLLQVAGCSKQQPAVPSAAPAQPTKAAVQQKPVQKQASSASALRLPPPVVNQFDFSNKKDPFKPFITVVKADAKKSTDKKSLRDSLPIHSFDVSQFKLIGVIASGRENKAMVTDPNGKGYVLKVGMLIGKNDGRIMAINSGGVDVLEQFKDDNGKVRKENIKLTLPRKQ